MFIGVPLILLFVLIAARRRRAAAGGADAVAAPSQPKRGRSQRTRHPAPQAVASSQPRRPRPGNAAHAAQPVAPRSPLPPSSRSRFAESAPPPGCRGRRRAGARLRCGCSASVDDPYVQEITFDDEQVAAFAEDHAARGRRRRAGLADHGRARIELRSRRVRPAPLGRTRSPAAGPLDDVFDEVSIDAEPEQPTGIIEMPGVPRTPTRA